MAAAGTEPRVLLLVTGGIAVYKSCFLTRLLVQAGFSVKVAMTDAAARFVQPMTFEVLSGHPVATDLWGDGASDALDHIEYARWADVTVVAPATANTLAKMAGGLADNIVTSLLLAFPGPVLAAPAMNDNMWRHAATQANRALLAERGVHFVGPGAGFLACGTVDEGRMAEPEEIVAAVRGLMADTRTAADEPAPDAGDPWQGRRVVVTAGPTHEPVDPVRYVGNRSSGAMGYALAAAAARRGAAVTLISGPSALTPPRGLSALVPVETARQMADAVAAALDEGADWLIMAAAVADYRPAAAADAKLKKDDLGADWNLALERNPDILAEVVAPRRGDGLTVVGFALETADVESRAQAKLEAKGLDFIVANDPTGEGAGFGETDHQVALVGPAGVLWRSESVAKSTLAEQLLTRLEAAGGAGRE